MEISRTRAKRGWTPAHSRVADIKMKIDDFAGNIKGGDEKFCLELNDDGSFAGRTAARPRWTALMAAPSPGGSFKTIL